jgi:hypothetical protein
MNKQYSLRETPNKWYDINNNLIYYELSDVRFWIRLEINGKTSVGFYELYKINR